MEGQSEVDGAEVPWRAALDVIKQSVGQASSLSLYVVKGLERVEVAGGDLADTVGKVKRQVEAA